MGERQFGPYRLVRQVAVGGMAEIHLAKTKGIAGFEKYVALKMIHPNFAEDEQFIQMLVDEAKIAVQLTHGNIAQTFDLGRVGDTYYITMEYVDGADLYKVLRRASEQDLEMPLDVCAFIAKEVASALDHAHRKRDHTGKSLGIVHRDVSPQNVLVSFAGEVKLVDFGIAKATMKVRQTAVGVIKGKYYYMSPEQARGERIDYRSDIFSAGIVLYEMITGQMLYLEEDLQTLLAMARSANIASPSTLRKGIPPQLEKIVMHALHKVPSERYQSAGDLASDLERFLHAYSPVFTAAKVSNLVKQIVGHPSPMSDVQDVEVHDGGNATFTLDTNDLAHASDELRDENSVIFRVSELLPTISPPSEPKAVTRRAHAPTESPPTSLPSAGNPSARTPPGANPIAPKPRSASGSKPRMANDETRQLASPPGGDELGGLSPQRRKLAPKWDARDSSDGDADLDSVSDRTVITAPSGGNFMMEDGESIEATLVTEAPRLDTDTQTAQNATASDHDTEDSDPPDDDEGPTMTRDFTQGQPRVSRARPAPPPAALAAKIHAPALSELRKPRASRRTPPDGVSRGHGNVLQQLVNQQANEPMPVPRAAAEHIAQPLPPPPLDAPRVGASAGPPPYMADASGLPPGAPTPPGMSAAATEDAPTQPSYPPPVYPPPPGYPLPPLYPPRRDQLQPGFPPGHPSAPVNPGALYQFQPHGQAVPTLAGQAQLSEVDEIPPQYKLGGMSAKRWFTYIVAGMIAVSVAASVTFFIMRATRDAAPSVGSVHIESVPPGAEVTFDGTRLTDRTPLTVDGVPLGSRHDVKIELPRHKVYTDTVDIPKTGGEVPVMALLKPITGKLVINSSPGGAEIQINNQNRGRTPTTISDVDMASSRQVELRLKDYQPYVQELEWPANGQIQIDVKLHH